MKRFVTYSLVVATIVWSLGLAAIVPAASAAYSATTGDYVKTADDTAVYYIGSEGKRHLFSNLVTFRSWDSTSWSDLVASGQLEIISQDDFDNLEVGANVTARPGVNLIKFDNSPKTYAVAPDGVLHHIVSVDAAEALFGADYEDNVIVIQSAFETNYSKTGADLTADSNLPDGSLIRYSGSDEIYYIQDGEKRLVTDEGFVANNFRDSAVRSVSASMTYSTGESITSEESAIADVVASGSGNGSGAADGTLTVTLAADTPASTTYIKSQARAPFTIVNLTNNSSSDVVVDSITIERGGLALDADFASVSAYLDSVTGTQIGLNKTLNSDHKATIGDDFTVSAGTSRKLILVGNMASDANAGDTPKLALSNIAVKSGATLNVSLPIWGNNMSINASVSLAAVQIGPGANNPSTNSAPKVGDTDVEIAEIKIKNNSSNNQDIQVEKIVIKQAGTVADSDVSEYSLVDSATGAVLATASQIDKYVEFNLASPVVIEYGDSENYMIKAAKIESGSSRTMQFDVYRSTDVAVKDLLYNAYVTPTYYTTSAFSTAKTSTPYIDNTQSQTIGDGTLKVEPSTSFPARNISENQDGVQIGEWLFTVKGESVDITNIEALISIGGTGTGTLADITNGIFYNVETGTNLTGASDASGGADSTGGVSSTDTITLPVGIHKIGLKVNLNADFDSNDTITVSIDPNDDLTVTGNVTGNTITASPTTAQSSAIQTIKTAALAVSVSGDPVAQNVIQGTEVEAANIVLDASASGDDISVTQLKTVIHTVGMSPNELTNLTILDGNTELALTNDPDPTSSDAAASVTTTWTLSNALIVPKGDVKTLTIKATTAGSTTEDTDTFAIGLQNGSTVTAKDSAGEDATITYSYSDGQNMTIKTTGSLSLIRSDQYVNAYLNGNTTGQVAGKFNATAYDGDVDIEKLYITMESYPAAGGTDELAAIYLYDGATLVKEAPITGSNQPVVLFNMEGDPLTVSAGTSKELTIKVDTKAIGKTLKGAATTSANPTEGFTMSIESDTTNVIAKTAGTAITPEAGTLTFASYIMAKSQPTVVVKDASNSLTASGTYNLIEVDVTASSKGPIGLYKMAFGVSTTTVSVTQNSYKIYENGSLVGSYDADATEGVNVTEVDNNYELVEAYFNASSLGGEFREIPAGTTKTYVLKASITAYDASTSNSVVTTMQGDDGYGSTYYNTAAVIDGYDDDDFIWSDLAYGNTSTTATTTTEWMNGFLVGDVTSFLSTTSTASTI